MTKKYLINYGGSLQISNNFKEGEVIYFEINTYLGDDNNIFLLGLDNQKIYDKDDNKIENLSDYKMSIVPGDGYFIKRDGSLKINGFRKRRCNGCTTYLAKKSKLSRINSVDINEKPYYPIDQDTFKICKKEVNKLVPIKLVGKIITIDHLKKNVDISISDYYTLTNYC